MSPTCQDANLRVLCADPQNCLSMEESVEARLYARDLVGKTHEVESAGLFVNLHWLFINTGPCL